MVQTNGDGVYATEYIHTVFIDTSLDTHMVMEATDSDTVSHLKEKIVREHKLCFPDVGDIEINSLKVKRKGYFYHLSDYMLVKSPFDGVKNWFLSVDAVHKEVRGKNQIPCISHPGNLLAIMNNPERLASIDDSSGLRARNGRHVKDKRIANQVESVCANGEALKDVEMEEENIANSGSNVANFQREKNSQPKLPEKYNLYSKEFEDVETSSGQKDDNFGVGNIKMQHNVSLEGAPHIQSVANEKDERKEKNKDNVDNHASKDKDVSVHESINDALQVETVVEISSGNAGREVSHIMENDNKSILEELHRTSSPNVNTSDSGVQLSKSANGIAITGVHVDHGNGILKSEYINVQTKNVVNEPSVSQTTAKRKRKAKEKDGSENTLMGKRDLDHDTVQPHAEYLSSDPPDKKRRKTENSNHNEKSTNENQRLVDDTAEQTSADGGRINGSVTLDSSIAAAPEDAHVLTTNSTKVKRKRKKRAASPLDQVTHAVQDSKNDVGRGSSVVTVKESDTPLAFGEKIDGTINSEPKEKLFAPLQEMKELDDNKDDDGGNMEDGIDTPGSAAMNVDDHLSVVAQEPESVATDFGISMLENTILDEINKSENQPGRVVEAELSKSNDPMSIDAIAASNLSDANGIMDFKTPFLKKKRKSKKAKDVDDQLSMVARETGSIETVFGITWEKTVLDENNKSKNQPSRVEEVELSKSNDPMSSDAVAASNLLDANGIPEFKSPSNKKRRSKIAKDPVDPVVNASTTSLEAMNIDHLTEKGEQNIMKPVEGIETKTLQASLPTTNGDTDVVNENPMNAESAREKSRKRKKRHSSSEKYRIALRQNNEDITGISEKATGAIIEPDVTINTDHLSEKATVEENIMQQTEEAETKTPDESNSIVERKSDTGILNVVADAETVRDKTRKKKKKKQNSTEKGQPEFQKDDEDTRRKSERAKELVEVPVLSAAGHTKGSLVENSSTPSHEAKSRDNIVELSQGTEMKTLDVSVPATNKETDNVIRNVLEFLQQGDENTEKAPTKGDRARKKKKIVSTENGCQDLQRDDKDTSRKNLIMPMIPMSVVDVSTALTKRNESVKTNSHDTVKHKESASGSSLLSFKRIVNRRNEQEIDSKHKNAVARKTSAEDSEEVVKFSEPKKSLLAVSGTIFNEQNDGSSGDEDGPDYSDASTQALSGHSVSSGYSDEESNMDFNSPEYGSYILKAKSGGKDVGESNSGGRKSMPLGDILRSSRRYKKAILSQADDSESQPTPLLGTESQAVPDSQPT